MAEIQSLLIAVLYDVGSSGADGYFGPATTAAVVEFQNWFAGGLLPPTGIVDRETFESLRLANFCPTCGAD